jgi:hypothetical protein
MSFFCVEDSGTLPRPAYDVDLQMKRLGITAWFPSGIKRT